MGATDPFGLVWTKPKSRTIVGKGERHQGQLNEPFNTLPSNPSTATTTTHQRLPRRSCKTVKQRKSDPSKTKQPTPQQLQNT